jgi:hypothetical protein
MTIRSVSILLVPDRDDRLGSHSGPVDTPDLRGQARYWREKAPPYEVSA